MKPQLSRSGGRPRIGSRIPMDHDFLDGIDERFERLMSESGNGNGRRSHRGTGRAGSNANPDTADPALRAVLEAWAGLSDSGRDKVLALVRSLKGQSNLF
jgi:hypothetical protein